MKIMKKLKILNIFRRIFVKKNFYYKFEEYKEIKKGEYPPEFAIIDYNPHAKDAGLMENHNKEIYIYNNEEVKSRPYSKAIIESMLIKNKIPYVDMTTKKFKLKVRKILQPDLIKYYESKD